MRYLKAGVAGVLAAVATLVVWQCLFIGWRILQATARGENDVVLRLPLLPMAVIGLLGFLFGAFLVLRRPQEPASR